MSQTRESDTAITVLWAVTQPYRPFVVRAWDHGLDESYGLAEDIREAKEWMDNWGDDRPSAYWTTVERIPRAVVPVDEEAFC